MSVVLYHIIRYRRQVVRTNLMNSFPEKSLQEIKRIEKKFYVHLCDLVVEAIKMFSITEKEISERFTAENTEVVNDLLPFGKNIVLAGGHLNSWEYLALFGNRLTKFRMGGVYKALANPFFEKKMRAARGKFGTLLIPTTSVYDFFDQQHDEPVVMIFATDQSPPRPHKAYWTTFLNQETGVQTGAERFARKHEMPVVYGALMKRKRGFYTIIFEPICKHPDELPEPNAILEKATRLLEKRIREQPEYWLWSHRRWKHKNPSHATNE